jgi:hypothetical protein
MVLPIVGLLNSLRRSELPETLEKDRRDRKPADSHQPIIACHAILWDRAIQSISLRYQLFCQARTVVSTSGHHVAATEPA